MYVYVYTFTHVYAYTGICTWAHINKLIHACMRVLWTWLYYLCSILAPHGIMTVGLRHMRPKPDKNNIALRHRCRRSHKQPHRHTGAQARRRTGAQAHRRTGAQPQPHSHAEVHLPGMNMSHISEFLPMIFATAIYKDGMLHISVRTR